VSPFMMMNNLHCDITVAQPLVWRSLADAHHCKGYGALHHRDAVLAIRCIRGRLLSRPSPRAADGAIVADALDHPGHGHGAAVGGVRPLRFPIVHAPRPRVPASNTSSAAS
jgi:hypothetical protein